MVCSCMCVKVIYKRRIHYKFGICVSIKKERILRTRMDKWSSWALYLCSMFVDGLCLSVHIYHDEY